MVVMSKTDPTEPKKERSTYAKATDKLRNQELDEPVKIRFTGATRSKVHTKTEHIDNLRPVFNRQKTNLVFRTFGEVEDFLEVTEPMAEPGQRTVTFSSQNKKTIRRVRSDLDSELSQRDIEVQDP
jgi:hypothetical protein